MSILGISLDSYGWNESSVAACHLADLALRHGFSVELRARSVVDRGVHHLWDSHVKAWSRECFVHCDKVIWVGYSEPIQKEPQIGEDQEQILWVDWHNPPRPALLSRFAKIVCPSKSCARWLCSRIGKSDSGVKRIRVIEPAIHGHSPVVREPNSRRLCVLLPDPASVRVFGATLPTLLQLLFDSGEDWSAVLCYSRGWKHSDAKGLAELLRRNPEKVQLSRRPDFAERIATYLQSDVVVSLGLRDGFGAWHAEIAACGSVPAAFHSPPASDLIRHGKDGLLAPCGLDKGLSGVPAPQPNLYDVAAGLQQVWDGSNYVAIASAAAAASRRRWAAASNGWLALWE